MSDTTDTSRTCRVVHPEAEVAGKQGHLYARGISAQSVGAQGIHLQMVRMRPGERAKAHKHEGHETAIHVLSGESGMWYGEKLEHHVVAKAGDFLYIRKVASLSSRAPIPTTRRASSCCRSWSATIAALEHCCSLGLRR